MASRTSLRKGSGTRIALAVVLAAVMTLSGFGGISASAQTADSLATSSTTDSTNTTSSTSSTCQHWMHLGIERPADCPEQPEQPTNVTGAGGAGMVLPCDPARQTVRKYDVVAFFQRIDYNRWGDHDSNGMMYSLAEDQAAIAGGEKRPRPLVLRANQGDCVEIAFTNKLQGGGREGIPSNPRAGMHFHGLSYDTWSSGGSAIGFSPDTQVAVGQTVVYRLQADREGVWMFHDHGTSTGGEADGGSNTHGLFGAFVVEPKGSEWRNPVTGKPTVTDLGADIVLPGKNADGTPNDYREFVIMFHDEAHLQNVFGDEPTDPKTGHEAGTHAINYGAEPARNRENCPTCIGEETSLSSWPYGDPALLTKFPTDPSNVFRAYAKDKIKIRLISAGVKETHVFHWHAHQWRAEPNDSSSMIIDSVHVSPGQAVTIDTLFGAGSQPAAPGDAIFHCHLYPHFAAGMWGLVRVLDRRESGVRDLPDGTPNPALQELPDRQLHTPLPTASNPGFPYFVPGSVGYRAPQSPYTVFNATGANVRDDGKGNNLPPTDVEKSSLRWKLPGAPMANPCPTSARKVTYAITAIQLNLTYNKAGWHDPQARILVPTSQVDEILSGKRQPEPLVMRANAGDCVEVRLTNKLPLWYGGNEFNSLQKTNMIGQHVHLVKFDPLGSDGASNGWNYASGAFENQTIVERWYLDVELRTIFTHDHFFANTHQKSGLYGALVSEPYGSTYRDPQTGAIEPAGSSFGVRKDIQIGGTNNDFREFVAFVHDFAPAFLPNGSALNPPEFPDSPDDPGIMALNYRNEPWAIRHQGDPAHFFSSWRHGDPSTPVFEGYANDPVRFRVIGGGHEEMHTFSVNGHRWAADPNDARSSLVNAQTLGTSEAFNFEMPSRTSIRMTKPVSFGDFLYGATSKDDLTLGIWGILRSHEKQVSGLLPLADRDVTVPTGGVRQSPTYTAPPVSVDPGNPCPSWAPVKTFDVAAIGPIRVDYNARGDHDPNGLVYVMARDEAAVKAGSKPIEPLTLRAKQYDCIVINLQNKLPTSLPRHDHDAPAGTAGAAFATRTGPGLRCGCKDPVTGEQLYQQAIFPDPAPGVRVGLNPSLVKYDVKGSDGTAVGYNPDQTVAPGGRVTYRWYADREVGAVNLLDFGDFRNHRHHGLFAGLVVEPRNSVITDPKTGLQTDVGVAVDVKPPSGAPYRDFAVYFQDGLNLHDRYGNHIQDAGHGSCPGKGEVERMDSEDTGEKGFNYRSEGFCGRLADNPDASKVMSSRAHGDPATPIFRAYVGDSYRFRVLQGADQPRNHAFHLEGAAWRTEPNDWKSNEIATQGGMSVGRAFNVHPLDPAGGPFGAAGDYGYRCLVHGHHVSGGLWGVFRVLPSRVSDLQALRPETQTTLGSDSYDNAQRTVGWTPSPYDNGRGLEWETTTSGKWHLSRHRSLSGWGVAFNNEDTHTYDAAARTAGTLRFPVDLTGTTKPTLSFYTFRDVRSTTSGAPAVDVMQVLVQPQGATDWTLLASWNSSTPLPKGWVAEKVDLSALAGQKVNVGFRFDSVDAPAAGREGWYIDDVRVIG